MYDEKLKIMHQVVSLKKKKVITCEWLQSETIRKIKTVSFGLQQLCVLICGAVSEKMGLFVCFSAVLLQKLHKDGNINIEAAAT